MKYSKFWFKYFPFIFLSLSAILIFISIDQFSNFKNITDQLFILKQEYSSCSKELKKVIKEYSQLNLINQSQSKKKNLDNFFNEKTFIGQNEPKDTFLVVNREPEYLRASALKFAKKYNLDDVLKKTFDADDWENKVSKPIRRAKELKRLKKKPKTTYIATILPLEKSIEDQPTKDFIFSWPIERSQFWLSSPFGWRKIRGRGWKFHAGIDMAACKGTPIVAAASGVVVQSGSNGGWGNSIVIAHNKMYSTRYAHLKSCYVRVGQKIVRGAIIGAVGDTGAVLRRKGRDASHLHFEIMFLNKVINPVSVLV